jgi:proline iminopeptidase
MSTFHLYSEIEPYRTGRLSVSDLHELFYEEVGNPSGVPALFLHGGPGVGIIPDYRRFFDPKVYRVILLDQRGAGRSTPHAELRENTTWDIVEDIEKLKRHLGIDRWILFGGSWGSLLALCYAIRYPQSVKGIIIRGIFLGRAFENDWIYKSGMSCIYPDQWEAYQSLIPQSERGDMVAAYYKRMTGTDEALRLKAAMAWSKWEFAAMNLVPDPKAIADFNDAHKALSVGRIECHFTFHKFFLETDNFVLENAAKIADIPCRIVQGRFDVICPAISAWDLHKALPKSELKLVQLGSHSPLDEGITTELVRATEDYKTL